MKNNPNILPFDTDWGLAVAKIPLLYLVQFGTMLSKDQCNKSDVWYLHPGFLQSLIVLESP